MQICEHVQCSVCPLTVRHTAIYHSWILLSEVSFADQIGFHASQKHVNGTSVPPLMSVYAIRTVQPRACFQVFAVKRAVATSQALSSLLWRNVTLRLSQHLVTDLEFADCCAAEERRVEVDMEMAALDFLGCSLERSLVYTHACDGCQFCEKNLRKITDCKGTVFQTGCRIGG